MNNDIICTSCKAVSHPLGDDFHRIYRPNLPLPNPGEWHCQTCITDEFIDHWRANPNL